MRLIFALSVIFLFALSGCGTQREAVKHLGLSVNQLREKIHARSDSINTLKAEGTITVEAPKSSNSGSFDVNLKKPDSVRIKFHGPFGLQVGTLSLSRDQFIFYNKMENTAVVGKPDGETLQEMFHLNLKFDELLHVLIGELPFSVGGDTLDKYYVEDDMYVVMYRSGEYKKEYRVNADDFIINSYRLVDKDGKEEIKALATRPTSGEDIPMPTLLRMIFPKDRRSITIVYDEIEINKDVECSFIMPENVERIYRR